MLSYPPKLLVYYIRFPQVVQQSCLPVVHVSHYSDNGWSEHTGSWVSLCTSLNIIFSCDTIQYTDCMLYNTINTLYVIRYNTQTVCYTIQYTHCMLYNTIHTVCYTIQNTLYVIQYKTHTVYYTIQYTHCILYNTIHTLYVIQYNTHTVCYTMQYRVELTRDINTSMLYGR